MTCYICDPENPNAAEEGCADCDREFWEHAAALAAILEADTEGDR